MTLLMAMGWGMSRMPPCWMRGWRSVRPATWRGLVCRLATLMPSMTTAAPDRGALSCQPEPNRSVERVQRTILEECWRPAFARSLVPKLGGLERDLETYLAYYNTERAHQALDGVPPVVETEEQDIDAPVRAVPFLGGLHHGYRRAA